MYALVYPTKFAINKLFITNVIELTISNYAQFTINNSMQILLMEIKTYEHNYIFKASKGFNYGPLA